MNENKIIISIKYKTIGSFVTKDIFKIHNCISMYYPHFRLVLILERIENIIRFLNTKKNI